MSRNLPRQMTSIAIAGAGGPEVLQPTRGELPRPAVGEVLLEVHAAGVNRPDVMQRQGMYPPPPGASEIPGLEVAGRIVELGPEVQHLEIGQTVCALVTGGGYAEYCTAPQETCLPVPAGFSMAQAAALPETYFTVWTNVFDRGRLRAGEHFLVHGGSSGIGTTAIQMAKAFDAKVYVTAGSKEKCDFCIDLGAHFAINYRQEDFVEAVKQASNARGVDLILDMVGGDYLPRNLKCLADNGRLVQIALQRGPKAEVNMLPIMLKRLTLTGSTLRPRSIAEKAKIRDALLASIWPLLEARQIKPIIHATFALTAASAAHALMDSGAHLGKIVLLVRDAA